VPLRAIEQQRVRAGHADLVKDKGARRAG
jgi:hypothetical protein